MSEPPSETKVTGLIGALRSLTLTNAVVIVLLACGLVPAYVVYRLLTEPALLDRFLSSYTPLPSNTSCRLIRARQRGEDYTYAITTGFAFEGTERWTIGVTLPHEPSAEQQQSNCLLLQTIIDFMHGMGPAPDLVWQQKDIQGREGQKGER
jgi:hypothetical protein